MRGGEEIHKHSGGVGGAATELPLLPGLEVKEEAGQLEFT